MKTVLWFVMTAVVLAAWPGSSRADFKVTFYDGVKPNGDLDETFFLATADAGFMITYAQFGEDVTVSGTLPNAPGNRDLLFTFTEGSAAPSEEPPGVLSDWLQITITDTQVTLRFVSDGSDGIIPDPPTGLTSKELTELAGDGNIVPDLPLTVIVKSDVQPSAGPVPEPSSLCLLGATVVCLIAYTWRRRRPAGKGQVNVQRQPVASST